MFNLALISISAQLHFYDYSKMSNTLGCLTTLDELSNEFVKRSCKFMDAVAMVTNLPWNLCYKSDAEPSTNFWYEHVEEWGVLVSSTKMRYYENSSEELFKCSETLHRHCYSMVSVRPLQPSMVLQPVRGEMWWRISFLASANTRRHWQTK